MYCFRSGSMRSHSVAVIDFRMALLSFDHSLYAFFAETYKMDYSALIYCYCYCCRCCCCWWCCWCFVYKIELVMMLLRLFASTFCSCLIGRDTFYQYQYHNRYFPIHASRCPIDTFCCLGRNSCRNCRQMRFFHDLWCDETMRHYQFYLVSIFYRRTGRSMNRSLNHCKNKFIKYWQFSIKSAFETLTISITLELNGY